MGMSMDMPPGAMGGNPMMMMNMMQQQQPQVNVVEPGLCLYFSRSSFILILFSVNLLLRSAWTTQEPMQERSRGSVLAPPQPPFQSEATQEHVGRDPEAGDIFSQRDRSRDGDEQDPKRLGMMMVEAILLFQR